MVAKRYLPPRNAVGLHHFAGLQLALQHLKPGNLCECLLQSVGPGSAFERRKTFDRGSLHQNTSFAAPQLRSSRTQDYDGPFAEPRVSRRWSSIGVPAWLEPWRCNFGQFLSQLVTARTDGGGKKERVRKNKKVYTNIFAWQIPIMSAVMRLSKVLVMLAAAV
jgi:hypothetical protein